MRHRFLGTDLQLPTQRPMSIFPQKPANFLKTCTTICSRKQVPGERLLEDRAFNGFVIFAKSLPFGVF